MKSIKLIENDSYLHPYAEVIINRLQKANDKEKRLSTGSSLLDFANGHKYFGLHKSDDLSEWIMREWAPASKEIFLIGPFSDWKPIDTYKFSKIGNGKWEIHVPLDILKHDTPYKLFMLWEGGSGERIPAWANRVVQNVQLRLFNAHVWDPPENYQWKYKAPKNNVPPLIYEAHVGMSAMEGKVATFNDFTQYVIPHIVEAGYNTVQLMAIQEHPYYGSFGYHVSSFFAVSSRFGTPDDLKRLIDTAHKNGLRVIMDIVHSHAVKNEVEGISRYDGTLYQFFHDGPRGNHTAWDSRCFDYNKDEVLHFLLSNCKYWLEEFNFDGFRFDGVTSMIYHDHGLGSNFMGYEQYYNLNQDEDAIAYLILANKLIHEFNPDAITIAEEMSGIPGMATPLEDGGFGFDFRLAMGTPDFWIKQIKEVKDEFWHVGDMYYNLSNKRADEKVINYAESHDQALVGDQTIIFRLMGAHIYSDMHINHQNLIVDRGMALHKMIRLLTICTAGDGYLNFMGNEFGHPEWIDFPREGNNWSFHYARRQWHLILNKELRYSNLYEFDKDFIKIIRNHNTLLHKPSAIVQNITDQVLIVERGDLFFVFNFSPFNSYTDYGFTCEKGDYKIILNSDSSKYAGHERIDNDIFYPSIKVDSTYMLRIYLPTQTCLIFKKL
ncbi:MAG: alpha-amylase family glycosyl hydrolase [Bacteroidales bacterium]|nr:alpha-amylase family glycosyl hydrolase [Bacteroidales bacterium]